MAARLPIAAPAGAGRAGTGMIENLGCGTVQFSKILPDGAVHDYCACHSQF
ncbi:hypothetical protein [Sphaerisporangium rufum]|uniref:hypothetical protein n=1 Tax=Sphaerisporangium rufum TaxID=1381558 RepID=UPI00194F19E2|nr:hypothetical protein [Sphaerisporangium rufum]